MLKTRITELLGIEHPIVQGAMAWVSFPPLVAAVSNAGGLGILGAAFMTAEEVRQNIREVKGLTSKPFGVNIIPDNPQLEEVLDVIVEEKPKVVSYGIGDPIRIIQRCKPIGIICLPTVGAVRHAVKAEKDGADAVVVQGSEGGGHCSYVATMVLVPLVVDKVKIPVVAAGGFADARGLVAALALGAEGVSMGTRFICTKESPVPHSIKMKYLQVNEEDTLITGHFTGVRCRVIRNKLAEEFMRLDEGQAPPREHMALGIGRFRKAFLEGDAEWGSLAGGQVVGLIDDIPSCQELIQRIVNGAERILHRLESGFCR
jgi:enoyl-[acyl-carrier protein] reductase II